jgi:hypothetical protein
LTPGPQRGSTGDLSGRDKKASVISGKTSFNRFSMFVKSGSENYMLGKVNYQIPELDVLTVVVGSCAQPDSSQMRRITVTASSPG